MTFRVDYFDDEHQNWIACDSLRDHIFDDDDGMWLGDFPDANETRASLTVR